MKAKKKRWNKFAMTSIPLRRALLGVTLWDTCYWVLPFEAILLLGNLASNDIMSIM